MNVVEGHAFVLRRNWIPVAVSLAVAILGVLALSYGSILLGIPAVWLGGWLAPIFFLRNAFPRATATTFRVTADDVAIEGVGRFPTTDVVECRVLPRGPQGIVELHLRDARRVSLRTSAAHAEAFLDVLGERRAPYRLIVPFWKRFFVAFACIEGLFALTARSPLVAMLVAIPLALFWAPVLAWLAGWVRGRLIVGADGLTQQWLFRRRFVPFRDIAEVEGVKAVFNDRVHDTRVVLTSGEKLRFRAVEAPNDEQDRGAEGGAMFAHVARALERARSGGANADVPALVGRGGRAPREWLAGLDALVRGGAGAHYRVAAVTTERLVEIAADPSATSESRVGAAAALVRTGDDGLRTRVRVLAEACAEASLREALLRVSDARDDVDAEAALALAPRRE